MEIVSARSAGFCFGVKRAVRMAEEAAAAYGSCACLGPLIHNGDVVRRLEAMGVRIVGSVGELSPGEPVIIRSHGIGRADYERLRALGCPVIDATCPEVARIHRLVEIESAAGRKILIIGERRHPEVAAIQGWCADSTVLENPQEVEKWLSETPGSADFPISVVSQTTGERKNFENSVKLLKKQCTNAQIFDTICNTTSNRQREAREIAASVDAMIVIGGRHSANTAKLAQVCGERCGKVLLIENASELDARELAGAARVGVTAGASTPEWIIKEVNRTMSDEIRAAETAEEETRAAETVETPAEIAETPAEVVEAPAEIAETPAETAEAPTETVETAAETAEASAEAVETPAEVVEAPAETAEASAEAVEASAEAVEAPAEAVEASAEAVETPAETVETPAEVVETPAETAETSAEAVEAPAETAETPAEAVEAPAETVETAAETGEKPEVPEEPATPEGEPSFQELLERSIKTLHTGEKVRGVVASITPSEISVDLGAKQSGYIPISEFTDEAGTNVSDMIHVGDEIEAFVMRVNDVDGVVMLSKKRLDSVKNWESIVAARASRAVVEGNVVEENKGGVVVNCKGVRVFVPASQSGLPKETPMSELLGKHVRLRITEVNQSRKRVVGSIRAVAYEERKAKAEATWNDIEVGKHYHGVVKSLTSYGAFVDIGGVDGMVHVSELSWKRIHQPSEVLKVGDEIDVYVISFDKENKKISLGYRDPNENPWLKFTSAYSEGSVAEVRIVKLMTFGAFAEIIPGVDGLIHISQIADRRIGKPEDVLSEGQVVKAKIIKIDNENKKVSLSIRALSEPSAPAAKREPEKPEEDDEPTVVYDTENPPAPEDLPQE